MPCYDHTSDNSNVTAQQGSYGYVLKVQCTLGYQLANESLMYTAKCNSTGLWTFWEHCKGVCLFSCFNHVIGSSLNCIFYWYCTRYDNINIVDSLTFVQKVSL